ncbi:MAG: hypothetical protein JKY92_05625 [Magnetovibrio sp.]|nr:hypothetical protein [Magnetovibrio sp.]
MTTAPLTKLSRAKALTRLGIAVGALYMAPAIVQLDTAHASGAISLASDPLTAQECSDCHPAYKPSYLRAYAWQKIMANLGNHFGEDASINDETTRVKIEEYLVYNASRPRRIGLRITEKKWFKRKHQGHKMLAKLEKNKMTFSNCVLCHRVKTNARVIDRRPK